MDWRCILTSIADLLFPPRESELMLRKMTDTLFAAYVLPRHEKNWEALIPYDTPVCRALIWELKYYHSHKASQLGGHILAEYIRTLLAEEMLPCALLIPIPMHKKRRRERGYNQTEKLCAVIAAELPEHIEYHPRALARTRYTKRQTTSSRKNRLEGVAGSMKITDPAHIRGRVCIVIDDVVTTGATLSEASRALKQAGAKNVHLLSLAYS